MGMATAASHGVETPGSTPLMKRQELAFEKGKFRMEGLTVSRFFPHSMWWLKRLGVRQDSRQRTGVRWV
jgi:hypothetical protein